MTKTMIPIERYYRQVVMIERLEQCLTELSEMAASTTSLEQQALRHAEERVVAAVASVERAQAAVGHDVESELLQAQLQASLELIHESPERMRRDKNEK